MLFSGFTGVRTLLSFAFACLAFGSIDPLHAKWNNPVLVALAVGNAIAIITLLL
jgi:uncharacterized membrane protein